MATPAERNTLVRNGDAPTAQRPRDSERRLRSRIVAAGAVLITAFGAAAIYDVWHGYRRTLADADREISNLAVALAEHTARSFQQIDLTLRNTAGYIASLEGDSPDGRVIHDYLRQQITGVPQMRALNHSNAAGSLVHTSRSHPPPRIDVSGRTFFTVQRDNPEQGLYIAEPSEARSDGQWAIAATRRVEQTAGKFGGIVLATTDIAYFEHFYLALKLGPGTTIGLYRANGTLLARHPATEALGRTFPFVPEVLAATPSGGPAFRKASPIDGEDRLTALRPVPGFGLAITVSRDVDVALSGWRGHARMIGAVTLSLSVLAVLLGALLLRKISEVESAHASLRVSEERYALAMEGSNEGHWVWDLDTDRLFLSERMRILHGTPEAGVPDTQTRWLATTPFHPDDRRAIDEALARHLEGRLPVYDVEYRVRASDGTWRWLHARGRARGDAAASARRVAGSVVDITDRKAAEEDRRRLEGELRQSQKLEAIGTLAGGIAHDFNNILGAILGYGEMAREASPTDGRVRRYLESILAAGNRAKSLVSRILAFSRGDPGERVPVRIEAVVGEAIELLRAALPKDISLACHLSCGEATVLGDATRLHQMVMNLCTNAAQAMGGRGPIEVTVEALELTREQSLSHGRVQPGRHVVLAVTDAGEGMDADTMERIFDPFFTTKRTGQGTGLGLSVVHGVVNELGGAIDVASTPGSGSTFRVYLPLAGTAAQPRSSLPTTSDLVHGRGERVMVVDDEKPLVQFYEELLAGIGYEPVGFDTARAALAAFSAAPEDYDLVLADLTMPEMDGIALAKALHAIRPGIPVILATGHAPEDLAPRIGDTPVRALLSKPLSAEAIATAIDDILRDRRPAHPIPA